MTFGFAAAATKGLFDRRESSDEASFHHTEPPRMSIFQTTCSLCRGFRDDLKCAAHAFLIFIVAVLFVAAILAGIACLIGVAFLCADQDAPWHAAALVSLGIYWGIYRDQC